MQFNVSDSIGFALSNIFNISIGTDDIPPQWSNPTKNRATIYQNYNVSFSTLWTDNAQLQSYFFSINQAGTWTTLSSVNFSGRTNFSTANVQISASPESTVYWRFHATDIFGNTNMTSIQNFTVSDFNYSGGDPQDYDPDIDYEDIGDGTYELTTGYIIATEAETAESGITEIGFKTDITNIKESLRQGDVLTRVVRITNTGEIVLNFSAYLENMENFSILGDSSFILESGEIKDLLVEFKIPKDTMPDQYFGALNLKTTKTLQVPIVLGIKEFEAMITLDVLIQEKYKTVVPENQVVATVTIQNMKDVRETTSDLFYAIKDFQGNIIESNNKEIQLFASFEEELTLNVPKDTKDGEYIFYARVLSGDNVDLDSDTFFIGSRFVIMKFLNKFLYPLIILMLIVIIIILVLIRKRSREKRRILELYLLLTELKNLVKKGKNTEALDIYKRIKVVYGQRIPKTFQQDKDKLKIELDKFSKLLKQAPVVPAAPETKAPEAKTTALAPNSKPTSIPAPKSIEKPKPASVSTPAQIPKPAATKPKPTPQKPEETK